jgi:hypothetical protein
VLVVSRYWRYMTMPGANLGSIDQSSSGPGRTLFSGGLGVTWTRTTLMCHMEGG